MTAQSPAQLAESAAESIRALNHVLYAGVGDPGDAYSTVGHLSQLVSMLPQAVTMIRGGVEKLERGGNLRSDRDALADDLALVYEGLERAADDAQALYRAITRAHGGLGHIGTRDGDA